MYLVARKERKRERERNGKAKTDTEENTQKIFKKLPKVTVMNIYGKKKKKKLRISKNDKSRNFFFPLEKNGCCNYI